LDPNHYTTTQLEDKTGVLPFDLISNIMRTTIDGVLNGRTNEQIFDNMFKSANIDIKIPPESTRSLTVHCTDVNTHY
jgi:hypothetical protein